MLNTYPTAVLLLFLFAPWSLRAHPHIFVDVEGQATFDGDVFHELVLVWQLDEMSSDMVLFDCDENDNRIIDPGEKKAFNEYYLEQFSNGNFSVKYFLDGEEVDHTFAKFAFRSVKTKDSQLRLTIACTPKLELAEKPRKLALEMAHPEYLIAYTMKPDEAWQSNRADLQLSFQDGSVEFHLPAVTKGIAKEGDSSEELEAKPAPAPVKRSKPRKRSLKQRFFDLQAYCNRKMAEVLLKARKDYTLAAMFVLGAFAFAYGGIHAAGPGHGKSLIVGFFLNHQARVPDAFKLAGTIAVTHSICAFILAGVFQTVFRHIRGVPRIQLQGWITFVIALCIVAFGVWVILRKFLGIRKLDPELAEQRILNRKTVLGVGLVAGMVPCPLSVTIMMLSMTNNVPMFGISAVLGIMLGTFVLLATAGFVTIHAKKRMQAFKMKRKTHQHLHAGIEIVGALLMVMAGIALAMLYFPAYSR